MIWTTPQLPRLREPRRRCRRRGAIYAVMLGIGDALGIQAFGHDVRQRAFADSNGAFYRNVPGEIEELGHEEIAFENIPSAASAQLRKKLTAG